MDKNITEEEREIMSLTTELTNKFVGMKQTHPSDINDVVNAIHRIQDIVACRIARRVVPDVFVTYEDKSELNTELPGRFESSE